MNLEILSKNFDLIVNAHGSVPKLKKWILQLAVQGKLVAQDSNDEPASELLKKIKAEKDKLIAEGKIKKEKPLTPVNHNEIPFEINKSWQYIRLGELVSILGDGLHGTPEYNDNGEYFFINGNNLSDGKIDIKGNTKTVSKYEFDKYKKQLNSNSVLVSINGTIGNIAFYNGEKIILGKSACYFNLLENINKYFIKILVKSQYFLKYAHESSTGTTIKNVSLKTMKEFIIPLPPLEEQKRIVSRVEQLMKLCDELEQQQKQVQEKRINFNLSATYHLSNSENQDDFNKYLQIINDNFDYLYDEPKNVAKLRETILQLAVQGKLVAQDLNDEPASELLKKIKAEKDKLIAEGIVKKTKALQKINHEEIPYILPKNWDWVRIGNLFDFIDYRGKTPIKSDSGVRLITAKNIRMGFINENPIEYLSNEYYDKWMTRGFPKNGDILFVTEGHTMGCVAMLNKPYKVALAQRTITFQSFKYNYNKFCLIAIMSKYFQNLVIESATGSAAMGIQSAKLKELIIPLPPLEEQKRIVTRIEQLMKLCDELELTIEKSRKEHDLLIQSVLNASLKPLEKDLALNY